MTNAISSNLLSSYISNYSTTDATSATLTTSTASADSTTSTTDLTSKLRSARNQVEIDAMDILTTDASSSSDDLSSLFEDYVDISDTAKSLLASET